MTAIDLDQYPHTFGTWTGAFGAGANVRLFVTDRDIYIDSFTFRAGTDPTVPDAYDFRIVYTLSTETSIGAWNAGTDALRDARTVTTVLSSTAGSGDDLIEQSNYTLTGKQNGANRIPAGSLVMVGSTDGNAGSASHYGILRWHTAPA